jgi:hypothetical protein
MLRFGEDSHFRGVLKVIRLYHDAPVLVNTLGETGKMMYQKFVCRNDVSCHLISPAVPFGHLLSLPVTPPVWPESRDLLSIRLLLPFPPASQVSLSSV